MIDPQHELEHLRKMAIANPFKRFGKLYRLVKHNSQDAKTAKPFMWILWYENDERRASTFTPH